MIPKSERRRIFLDGSFLDESFLDESFISESIHHHLSSSNNAIVLGTSPWLCGTFNDIMLAVLEALWSVVTPSIVPHTRNVAVF
jgi:hypothetical protein